MIPGDESDEELLAEFVGSPYWRVLLHEIDVLRGAAEARLIAAPTSLLDVVTKERHAGQLSAFQTLIRGMEQKAKQVRHAQSSKRA